MVPPEIKNVPFTVALNCVGEAPKTTAPSCCGCVEKLFKYRHQSRLIAPFDSAIFDSGLGVPEKFGDCGGAAT
jgi:hypothetical protein